MSDALPRNQIIIGDALEQLRRLPDQSVDMVLTSPPYFRLRDYDVAGQLGTEQHVDDWVHGLLPVTRELRRVLLLSGSFWFNLGDTYSTHARQGAARKSLLLGPERLALAMAADGWVLRNKIVWAKTNTRPTSVKDRLSASWEPIYLFAASSKPGQATFFDLDAVRVPHKSKPPIRPPRNAESGFELWRGPNADNAGGLAALRQAGRVGHVLGKNPSDVWPLASSSFRGGHHATFPISMATRAILAGCPEGRCIACCAPYRRAVQSLGSVAMRGSLAPSCLCVSGSEPGIVLDPFIGAGSTAVAAEQLQRDWLGIELNPTFAAMADQRIRAGRSVERTADEERAA